MAFYKCSKCGRVWQQPVKVCPYCLIKLEKMKSGKSGVIGISKVSIPTLFHPKVPYFLLLVKDENNNRWAHKSIKEVNINEELHYEADKDAVAVWRIKYDIFEAVEKALSLIKLDLNGNSKVLIMPTLISPNHPYFRENTSPEFLKAVLDFVLSKNAKIENIKVGTQSFDEMPIEASVQKSGLLEVCMEKNIMPIDLSKGAFVSQDGLEISEEVLKADIVLNLAILKMGKASAVNNTFRVLKKENYESLKYLSNEKDIINKIEKALPNVITLGEAEFVQRSNKLIAFMGLILAGKNPLRIDRVFNEIATANNVPEIIRDINIEDIKTVGREIEEVKYNAETF